MTVIVAAKDSSSATTYDFTTIYDKDSDGFNILDDCDDNNSLVNPNSSEICWNDIDDNCNNVQDELCSPLVSPLFQS